MSTYCSTYQNDKMMRNHGVKITLEVIEILVVPDKECLEKDFRDRVALKSFSALLEEK